MVVVIVVVVDDVVENRFSGIRKYRGVKLSVPLAQHEIYELLQGSGKNMLSSQVWPIFRAF